MLQAKEGTQHPVLGTQRALAGVQNEVRFESYISPERQRWLSDHTVFDDILFPGAGYVEMLVSALGNQGTIHGISFEMPLMIGAGATMQTVVKSGDAATMEIYSQAEENAPWIRNVSATFSNDRSSSMARISIPALENNCTESADVGEFYKLFAALGIYYGPEFQTIQSLRYNDTEVLARLELKGEHQGFQLPPMLLDGAFQSLAVGLLRDSDSSLFLPVGIEEYQSSGTPTHGGLWCHGKWNETEGDNRTANLTLADDRGNPVARIKNLKVRAVSRSALRQMVGSTTERLLYTVSWKQESLPSPESSAARWLIVSESKSELTNLLTAKGHHVTEAILTDLAEKEAFWAPYLTDSIDGIIWNTGIPSGATYTKRHGAGILSLLHALRTHKVESLPRGLQIVTSSAISALPGDHIDPDSAQFWGLGRVVSNENPPLRGRLLDCPEKQLESLVDILLSPSPETQIAVREGESFIPRLIPAKAPALRDGLPVMEDATYLITGGLGMLGRRAAEWLASRGAGHIVLVSRREPDESTKDIISEIEKTGCKVHVKPADISNRKSIKALFSFIEKKLPPLRGILHAAGVLDDGLLAEQNWEKFEKVLAPKRQGASLLHEATKDTPLDFFVLYSSAASILGSPGQANYAMGNAYLDGLAQQRVSEGLPAVSVNFGPWNEGMAATEKVKKALDMQGLTPLTAEEAHEGIDRMLDNGLVQATMLDADWGQMRQRFPADPPAILDDLWPDSSLDSSANAVLLEKLRESEDDPESETSRDDIFREHVEQELQQVLSLPQPPGPDVALAELGLDSLMAVEFATRLQRQVGSAFAIPPTVAFDYPSVSKLTDFLSNLISNIPLVGDITSVKETRTVSPVRSEDDAVAIVGLGCRFPGADGVDEYWRLLRNGVDGTCEIPSDRWNVDELYDPVPASGKIYTKRGGFLPDIAEFDAKFFGISDQDASWMDPQHRMMLEVSWHALQSAGLDPKNLEDPSVGVFMGIMSTDYAQIREHFRPEDISGSQGAGLSHSAGVGRINYMFGFEGPSLAVDTASSSSLVAVCQAVKSLLDGECNLALAGGVNAILSPVNSLLLCKGKVLSPDGRCKSFSAAADGFARGEGCGIIALKRLSDAERDGDRILSVIRGTAISHNGHNAGLTAPSGKSQQQMLERALKIAGIEPADIDYLEAHATGTELGDPIEVIAATQVLGRGRSKENPLLLGSAKANLGHLEAAGGISGLIKVVLAMQNGVIPGQINFDEPSPHIPWDQIHAKVVTTETAWPNPARPLAGVNALGMTGTNAHVILEGGYSPGEFEKRMLTQFKRKKYWFPVK
ncbi:MAG: SDR family NAD(P)-dependent oxidoreductase [Verrucomicrobiales bacterium]|nr:SDR family NAD(P)-dependent oxidoreductase [Verrucomicrobiales bacterium]